MWTFRRTKHRRFHRCRKRLRQHLQTRSMVHNNFVANQETSQRQSRFTINLSNSSYKKTGWICHIVGCFDCFLFYLYILLSRTHTDFFFKYFEKKIKMAHIYEWLRFICWIRILLFRGLVCYVRCKCVKHKFTFNWLQKSIMIKKVFKQNIFTHQNVSIYFFFVKFYC